MAENPSSGTVELFGKCGLVFQEAETQILGETPREDIAFGPKNFGIKQEEALELAHKALIRVGLNESFFERSPFELSGGENALNKRILNVPQSDWEAPTFDGAEAFSAQSDASAVFSPSYATGVADGTVEGPFKKPCGC